MDPNELLEHLKQLAKRFPNIYRHIVGTIKAVLAL